MRVVVCVKQVPLVTSISIDPERGTLNREGVPSVLNPFCEYALEQALRVREEKGGEVVVISMGPPQARQALLRCMELGADRGYLLSDRAFAGSDVWATAGTLKEAVERLVPGYGLILTGQQAMDGDTAQVPGELAEMLDLPQVGRALEVHPLDEEVRVIREAEDRVETVRSTLPCLVSVSKGGTRRFPSMRDLIGAREREIVTVQAKDLGIPPEEAGLEGSRTRVIKVFPPPQRGPGRTVKCEDPWKAAREIIDLLDLEGDR
ncbi:MAG: electron transfer flavoprotein subunit beta/FixA family protein [Methanomassiliicoccales archaeon]